VPLTRGERGIAFSIGLKNGRGEGCDEFEVLSAHFTCVSFVGLFYWDVFGFTLNR
jgi:hypothetical protein